MKIIFQFSYSISSAFFLLLISTFAFAQAPQKFNYQGIARDAKGNPMSKQTLALKLSVLPTSDATVPEYEETQLVTTNEFGLYTLQIGNGTAITGEMKTVKWETGNKYIKVAIDPTGGTNYVDAGTNQLLSVPYALYADKAGESRTSASGTKETRSGTVSTSAAGTGTTNYLAKFTGANTIYNSQIFDNGSQIGIGTTSPSTTAKLHIASVVGTQPLILESPQGVHNLIREAGANRGYFGSYIGSGAPYPTPAGTSNADFDIGTSGSNPTGKLHLATQTTPRLTIDNVGKVGIGTISPTQTLHVVSSDNNTALFTSNSTTTSIGIVKSEYIGTTVQDHIAVSARSVPDAAQNYGIGIYGEGGYVGVQSLAKVSSATSTYGSLNEGNSRGETYGIYGLARPDIPGNYGTKVGVYGKAQQGIINYGVFGDLDPIGGTTNFAGYFNGQVGVNGDLAIGGNLSKAGGTFKIDHPQDPANKYLIHSFVESPDMMNIYNGNVLVNANKKAIIDLPSYFEAENKDFRYQLTVIGKKASVWVSKEISNNQFEIETDEPNVKISWQVTGVRKDAWAENNRVQVEVDKAPIDKGYYLHPTLFGKPTSKQIGYNDLPKNENLRIRK